jgi:hypothetical protein
MASHRVLVLLSAICEEADLRSGPDFAVRTVSVYDAAGPRQVVDTQRD